MLNEIWKSFKSRISIITKNPTVIISIFIVVFLLVGGFVLYKAFSKPKVTLGIVGDDVIWQEYDEMMDLLGENKIYDDFMEDSVEEGITDASLDATYIETTIASFFYYANKKQTDLWISYISQDRMSRDFNSTDLLKRLDELEQAVDKISRNGKIKKVEIVTARKLLVGGTSRIVLDIYYDDLLEPVRTNVEIKYNDMKPFNDVLGESYNVPLIQSSVWELIKDIENQTND